MELHNIHIRSSKEKTASSVETQAAVPSSLSSHLSSLTFEAPVTTLDQLRAALIQRLGPEKGQEMYDNFVRSMLTSTFGLIHKDMDRAQRASRRFRQALKD